MTSPGPAPLADFSRGAVELEQEVRDLATLAECGLPVARIVVVPPEAEAEFYRLNNLCARLRDHFSRVRLSDPDDEDIEDLAPEAEALVYGHYLLDEFIDRFYAAIDGMDSRTRVRRPGSDGITAPGARASLLAVKRAWSSDWSFGELWQRLVADRPLVPLPRPLLVHTADMEPLAADLSRDASALLGRPLNLLGGPASGISRVVPAAVAHSDLNG